MVALYSVLREHLYATPLMLFGTKEKPKSAKAINGGATPIVTVFTVVAVNIRHVKYT